MSHLIHKELLSALAKIDRPSLFCTSGEMPPVLPGLQIEGVGEVALPLTATQAKAIRSKAHQAPYGKGTETLVDTNVRRVWELDPGQFSLENSGWQQAIAAAVSRVQGDLGLDKQKLEAHLYKLLLYEKGSFFLPHRDGEKLDRMVATMVVALPSAHQGGELVVRHEGSEVVVDFAAQNRFQAHFAAFYADCEHEVRPVVGGHRLSLVYNLTLAKGKRGIEAPRASQHIEAIAKILKMHEKELETVEGDGHEVVEDEEQESSEGSEPIRKLAVLLEHQYSEAGLTFDALKGVDRAQADVLFAAAAKAGWEASLALVTLWESGSGEPEEAGDYYYGGRRRRYSRYQEDDDDEEEEERDDEEEAKPRTKKTKKKSRYVMHEVIESSLDVDHFSDTQGNARDYGSLPLFEEEIVAKTPLMAQGPDEEQFEGFTGNAGMTLERWYRRAAIVLWPKENFYDVLVQAGPHSAALGLAAMTEKLGSENDGANQSLRESCIQFARKILRDWPEREHGYWREHDGSDAKRDPFLTALERIGEPDLTTAWIRRVLARDASYFPGAQLGGVLKAQGWQLFEDNLQAIWKATSDQTLERNTRLLVEMCQRKDKDNDRRGICAKLAQVLLNAVERWRSPDRGDFRAKRIHWDSLLPELIQIFVLLEDWESLSRLHRFVRERKEDFDLIQVQLEVWLELEAWLRKNLKTRAQPLIDWWTDLRDELHTRVFNVPQPPRDWRRPADIRCNCKLCAELRRFLESPTLEVVRYPLVAHDRNHLENTIRHQELDASYQTERIGRPHTLVLRKTTGSYERALKVHQTDSEHLQKVVECLQWLETLKG